MKSKLRPPKIGAWLFPTEAVYGKNGKPVCGLCWSKLDPDWGKNRGGQQYAVEGMLGAEGPEYVDPDGEVWGTWEEPFKCANPECDAGNLVRYIPAKLTYENPYHPEDRKKNKLPAKAYKDYQYDEYGIYLKKNKKGEYAPIKLGLEARGVEVEYDDPWVYINPGSFDATIPGNWTRREDGWIKTNGGSKRFQEIRKWFSDRRIDLDDLNED